MSSLLLDYVIKPCYQGLARSLHSNLSQSCSIGLRSGLCAGQSSSSTPNSLIHVLMDLALCTGAHYSHAGTGRGHPQTVPTKSKMSCYAEALRVPLTGTQGQSPTPEKQPHFTLCTLHNAVRQVSFSWQSSNPDSSIGLGLVLHHCFV